MILLRKKKFFSYNCGYTVDYVKIFMQSEIVNLGRLGGSVKHRPSARVSVPRFWDQVLLWCPCLAGSLFLPVPQPFPPLPALFLPLS